MYASYRKIKCAGGITEEKLGYECQGKPNGERCPQCRVKAETIFDSVTRKLEKLSPKMDEKRYREYLYAVYAFTNKKEVQWKTERTKIGHSLTKMKSEKRKLIEQRAQLVSKDMFDQHSKELYTERMSELTEMIFDAEEQRKMNAHGFQKQVKNFHQFLELRTNLVQYWKLADYSKKAIFSKIVLLNLSLR